MLIEFSDSDLLSSKIVQPGWYKVSIDDVEERASNDGTSTNAWIKGHIICNDDTGNTDDNGVPTPYLWMINSKGAFAAVGLFSSIGMEIKAGSRANTSALKGKEVVMFIGNELYKGKMQNCVTGQYRAVKS